MRVLVVGAGIAGLTAAHGLARAGADVGVADKASRLDAHGYYLNLVGQCLSVLEAMGLREALEAARVPVRSNRVLERDGTLVRALDLSELNAPGVGLFVRRSALQAALVSALGPAIDLRLGTPVHVTVNAPDGVRVQLGGAEDTFDLVIGSDGVHSAMRHEVSPSDAMVPLGVHYVAINVEGKFPDVEGAYTVNGPGRAITLTMVSDHRWTGLFWVRNADEPVPRPGEVRAYLARQFSGFGWIVRDLIERIDEQRCHCGEATQVRAERWNHDAIALLGDAAWCLSPVAARGGAAALVGARRFVEALAAAPDLATASADFEREFRPVVHRAQQVAAQTLDYMLPLDEHAMANQARYLRTMSEAALQHAMRAQFADGL